MREQRLMLISRDAILEGASGKNSYSLFRTLARLTRGGFQLLATAPQPDTWSHEHGGPDDALLGPDSIRRRLSDAGGLLDGVYYVPRSLLTQKRNREEALQDMMERYSIAPELCYLFSSSRKFVSAARGLGLNAVHINKKYPLVHELKDLLKSNSPQKADPKT